MFYTILISVLFYVLQKPADTVHTQTPPHENRTETTIFIHRYFITYFVLCNHFYSIEYKRFSGLPYAYYASFFK